MKPTKQTKQGMWKNGIWITKDYVDYIEKADKYDKIVALAKEENNCRKRIKQIGQERAKIIGVADKYAAKH